MKRPHRRAHLMAWLIIAPVTALASVFFWMHRESTPYADVPPLVETGAIEEAR
ncbi:MAG: hypothetical protein AAGD92_15425 [Pseudomonadota bacterium]